MSTIGRWCTQHTHSVHDVQYSLFTSTHGPLNCVLVAQGVWVAASLCASKNPSSGRPCHPLAGLFHISSLPVHHSTLHYLDSADLLQEDPVHLEQLPQEPSPKTSASAIRSESNAEESISLLNYESAGNLRPNTPTGLRAQRSSRPEKLLQFRQFLEVLLETLDKLYDVQRELGEQNQQAPVMEVTRVIWTNSGTKLTRSEDGKNVTR